MEEDEDWIERMCSFLDRWNTEKRAIAVLTVAAGCAGVWWCVGWIGRDMERYRTDQRAVAEHIQWLNRLPETEKKSWPTTSICRPGVEAPCRCPYAGGDTVDYMEILANGDVACHQTK